MRKFATINDIDYGNDNKKITGIVGRRRKNLR